MFHMMIRGCPDLSEVKGANVRKGKDGRDSFPAEVPTVLEKRGVTQVATKISEFHVGIQGTVV